MSRILSLLLCAAVFLGGCVSTSTPIPPDSLTGFRDAMVELDKGSKLALTAEYDWTYQNYREQIKASEEVDARAFMLCPSDDMYTWNWGACEAEGLEPPLINDIAATREMLGQLNRLFIDYGNFLVQFNAANENTQSSLEATAEKVGNSVQSIGNTFGQDLSRDKIGAFANIGAAIVGQWLAKKQRDGMADVMQEFQAGVEAFSALGYQAMENSAFGIQDEYQTQSEVLANKIKDEADGARRFGHIEQLLELNEKAITSLDRLGSLDAAYRALPGAHLELIMALEEGRSPGLGELVGHIETISAAYQTISE